MIKHFKIPFRHGKTRIIENTNTQSNSDVISSFLSVPAVLATMM